MITRDIPVRSNLREKNEEPIKRLYELPKVGSVIIFNEKCKYHTRSGRDYWPLRGLCEVMDINGRHVIVKVFKNTKFQYITSLNVIDFRIGIMRFIELEKSVLEQSEKFTYKDYDIDCLHEELSSKIVINKEKRKGFFFSKCM